MSKTNAVVIVSLAGCLPKTPEYENVPLIYRTEVMFSISPAVGWFLNLREKIGVKIDEISLNERNLGDLPSLTISCSPRDKNKAAAESLIKAFKEDIRWNPVA